MRSDVISVTSAVVVLLTALMCYGCAPKFPVKVPVGWTREDVGDFSFYLPPTLKRVTAQGIDSEVRRYESETIVVTYDYGWYSDDLTLNLGGLPSVFRHYSDTVGGLPVTIGINFRPDYEPVNPYFMAVHFPHVPRDHSTMLTVQVQCRDTTRFDTAMIALKSIRFR